jgi:protein SCO1
VNRKRVVLAVALLTGAIAAVGVVALARGNADLERQFRGSPPPSGIQLPDFELRSYTGETIRRSELAGKVVVVTFLETKCKEACPIIAWQVARTVDAFSEAVRERVAFIAISTHPADDTPQSVRRFLVDRHALGTLDYLIGSERELRPVWSDFSILSALDSGEADTHSASVRVFDSSGIWVSTLHAGVDLTQANLSHDVMEADDGL